MGLTWMDKIRARLKEYDKKIDLKLIDDVAEFIKPIFDYGESEERRITKALEEQIKNGKL